MGRVNKYKKLKACDPAHKSHQHEVFDLPEAPRHLGRDVPKSFRRLMETTESFQRKKLDDQERQPQQHGQAIKRASADQNGPPAKRIKVEPAKDGEEQPLARLRGESLSAFGRRVDQAHADKVVQAARRASRVSKKHKDFSKKKKDKSAQAKEMRNTEQRLEATLYQRDKIKFGDVVLAPPNLESKPRKAPVKTKSERNNAGLHLSALLGDPQPRPTEATKANPTEAKKAKKADKVAVAPVRKLQLEQARQEAIDAYRSVCLTIGARRREI